MIPRLVAVAAGTLLYLVMVGQAGPWAILQGALFTAGALALAHAAEHRPPSLRTLRRLLPQLPDRVVRQSVCGSVRVASAALGLRPLPSGGFVELRYPDPPRANPAAAAVLETISPGSYLVAVDAARRTMLFHVFDAREAERLRARMAELLGAADGELRRDGPDTGGVG